MARILVVDDEEGIRSFLAEALESEGHQVVQAADGERALRLLAERGFELLITDLKMPGLDGLELMRRVRAEQPELEIVMLTAHGTVETAVEAMKLGAFDYLQKPIDVDVLAEKIKQASAKSRRSRQAETAEPEA